MRKVRSFISFSDPCGITIELVVRSLHSGWRYFPTRDAGIVGLSGVALRATDVPACEGLWTRLFNGRVSDWVGNASFLRFDRTHHRLAYYPSDVSGIFAIELGIRFGNEVSVDPMLRGINHMRRNMSEVAEAPQ